MENINYISVDVETTGLVPGVHSLLSVGAYHLVSGEKFHGIISSTESHADELVWEPSTYDWWMHKDQENARNRLSALEGIVNKTIPYWTNHLNVAEDFHYWLQQFKGDRIFVGWPASFDYPFIMNLFHRSDLQNPFNYRTLDVKSYACGKFNVPINCEREALPDWMFEEAEYPHDALSDAIMQAYTFIRLMNHGTE